VKCEGANDNMAKDDHAATSEISEKGRNSMETKETEDDEFVDKDAEGKPGSIPHRHLSMRVEVVRSIHAIQSSEWDSLLASDDSPFLEHDWLRCLEDSGSVSGSNGWYPFHLVVREVKDESAPQLSKPSSLSSSSPGGTALSSSEPGRLLAVVPMYAKTHSMGEFVFDQSWAEAAYYQLGIEYYPKLLAAIPFTPATGKRIITHPDVDRPSLLRTCAGVMEKLAVSNDFSSVHILFCEEDEATQTKTNGYLIRNSVQNHFENKNPLTGSKFGSFDEYVATLKPNRRKALRRERKKIYNEEGINLTIYEGDEVTPEIIDTAYELYSSTVEKFTFQKQYLNKDFFTRIQESNFRRHLVVVLARRGNKTIGGTFNVQKGDTLYGRYWGCFEEVPYLYFEACYYRLIQHVIEKNMTRMEAGAGSSGGGKLLRGFDASITRSSHYIHNPNLRVAVSAFLEAETAAIEEQKDLMNENMGAFKSSLATGPRKSEEEC